MRLLDLQRLGVRDTAQLRLLLWLDGYPVVAHRVEADLATITQSAHEFASDLEQGYKADRVVIAMLNDHDPFTFISWARQQLPKRSDLEAALLQSMQLASGTAPSELMLDGDSAAPLQRLLSGVLPGMTANPDELAQLMSLDEFASFMREVATFTQWSFEDWCAARDDQLILTRTGRWFPPAQEISAFVLLPMRLASLIVCGALRRSEPRRWEEQMLEVRRALTGPESSIQGSSAINRYEVEEAG